MLCKFNSIVNCWTTHSVVEFMSISLPLNRFEMVEVDSEALCASGWKLFPIAKTFIDLWSGDWQQPRPWCVTVAMVTLKSATPTRALMDIA